MLYTLFPIFGSAINASSFVIPVLATVTLGLKTGMVAVVFTMSGTALVFCHLTPMPFQESIPRFLLASTIQTVLCFSADWAKRYFFLHRKAQSDLEDTEKRYRMIFENSVEGILCLDNNGIVVDANPRAASLLGIPFAQIIGAALPEMDTLPSDFRENLQRIILLQGEIQRTGLALHLHSNHQSSTVFDVSISNINQKHQPISWILMFKDATEQRKMEAQLQESKRMESLGRLAGGLAHDMNNILNAIMGASYALNSEISSGGEIAKDIDTITRACDQGAKLTRNLLGFARKSNRSQDVFPINELIESVLTIIRRTAPKSIRIITSLNDEPLVMEGDRGQIESAIMNLCINALDAMGERGTLEIRTDVQNGDFSLSIADTGSGIDESIRELVFEPFFTTKPVGKGTGLGLAMVYGAVQNHGGAISVESTPGLGTTMNITFKRYKGDIGVPEREDATPTTMREHPLRGLTVLLVDDDAMVLRASERFLSTMGARVIPAESGAIALDLFVKHQKTLDFIIADLVMPDVDGAQLLKRIRAMKSLIPALVVSGYSADSEKLRELKSELALFDFLPKPYRPNDLLSAIDKLGVLPKKQTASGNRLTLIKT